MGLTYGDLRRLYAEHRTIPALVEHLGVSRRSVINWMREAGIAGTVHRTHVMRKHRTTALFQWIKEHPGVALPQNIAGISAITGINKKQVKEALYRREKKMQAALRELGPIMDGHGTFVTRAGVTLPVSAVACYSLRLEKYSLDVMLEGELRDSTPFVAKMTREQYRKLCNGG